MGFHLMDLEPVVEIGNFGQGVGGDQPDFHAAGIGDANQIEVGIDISGGQSADALLVWRRSFLWRSLRLIADQPQVAGKCAVHHNLQLFGEFLTLRRALGVGHLQILRCSGVVSRLNGMEKSVYGAVGSVTAQWVRCGRRLGSGTGGGARLGWQQLSGGSPRDGYAQKKPAGSLKEKRRHGSFSRGRARIDANHAPAKDA